jgi:hypothetical protein
VFVADAEPAFADKERVAIEHIFVSWLGIDVTVRPYPPFRPLLWSAEIA